MKFNGCIAWAILTLIVSGTLRADVAPPKGYLRMDVGIVLETREDLGKFRFFLISSDLVKPLSVKKGEKTFIGALGGGARYNSGVVVAIPSKSLSRFGDDPSADQLSEMKAAIASDSVAGAIKLINHMFRKDVREAEAMYVSDAVYRIDKVQNSLTAVPVGGVAPAANSNTAPVVGGYGPTQSPGRLIAVGVLMSLGMVSVGFAVHGLRGKKSA